MTFSELIGYQEWYRSLERKDQSAYISSLGSSESPEKERQLRSLAREYLHKEITGCGFCIQSAHFEIMNLDISKMEKLTNEYQLLPGAVLHDPINKDFNKILTARNITEELALYHIANNKGAISYFSKLPADLADRLQEYLKKQGKEMIGESRELGEKRLAMLGRQAELAKSEMDAAENAYNRAMKRYEELKNSHDSLEAILDGRSVNEVNALQDGHGDTGNEADANDGEAGGENPVLDVKELEQSVKELVASGMDWDEVKNACSDELNDGRLNEDVLKGVFTGLTQGASEEEDPSKKKSSKTKGGSK